MWIGGLAVLGILSLGLTQFSLGQAITDSFRGSVASIEGRDIVAEHFPAGTGSETIVLAAPADVAAVTATREERAREFAIMRAVGARGSLLRQVQRAELAGVGLLAGFLASCVAGGVGWALAHYVFEFEWTLSLWVPVLGSLAGAALALAAGWWGLRDVLKRPVVETLRRAVV